MNHILTTLMISAAILAGSAHAQTTPAAPASPKATPEQREAMREKLQNLTPEEKAAMRERTQKMTPEERAAMREKMQNLTPEQKAQMREKGQARWDAMTPEEKAAAKKRFEERHPGGAKHRAAPASAPA